MLENSAHLRIEMALHAACYDALVMLIDRAMNEAVVVQVDRALSSRVEFHLLLRAVVGEVVAIVFLTFHRRPDL